MELPYIDENSQIATDLFSGHEPKASRSGLGMPQMYELKTMRFAHSHARYLGSKMAVTPSRTMNPGYSLAGSAPFNAFRYFAISLRYSS